jgi:D-alanyl-D-alanine carboxypeptidase/D-alanyl-D-alanine-endopeptidase (penicillin-binding protein 4)
MLLKTVKRIPANVLPFLLLALLLLPHAVAAASPGSSGSTTPGLRIDNGGYALEKGSRLVAAYNLHDLFVPASVIKVATSLAALDLLGPTHRFETVFFLDEKRNLYIKGYGDPFLISEEVAAIAGKIKELGGGRINDIYTDDSAFFLPLPAEGSGDSANPYDALNSGLAVNFNTVKIEKDRKGNTRSAEEQTPTLDLMASLGKDLAPGVHRISLPREENGGTAVSSRYVGELFRAFLRLENIGPTGKIERRKTPAHLAPFYIHRSSRTVEESLAPLMLYSNNFIANQLYLLLGAKRYGYPASWEKARRAMAEYLQDRHALSGREIRVVEGAGLSRKNRVSPAAMLLLLNAFKPYAENLPQEKNMLVKSGTLQGVYSYAGYFVTDSRLDSFVLLLNQPENNRDQLLMLLEEIHRKDDSGKSGR